MEFGTSHPSNRSLFSEDQAALFPRLQPSYSNQELFSKGAPFSEQQFFSDHELDHSKGARFSGLHDSVDESAVLPTNNSQSSKDGTFQYNSSNQLSAENARHLTQDSSKWSMWGSIYQEHIDTRQPEHTTQSFALIKVNIINIIEK
jgi:hypothetical protein